MEASKPNVNTDSNLEAVNNVEPSNTVKSDPIEPCEPNLAETIGAILFADSDDMIPSGSNVFNSDSLTNKRNPEGGKKKFVGANLGFDDEDDDVPQISVKQTSSVTPTASDDEAKANSFSSAPPLPLSETSEHPLDGPPQLPSTIDQYYQAWNRDVNTEQNRKQVRHSTVINEFRRMRHDSDSDAESVESNMTDSVSTWKVGDEPEAKSIPIEEVPTTNLIGQPKPISPSGSIFSRFFRAKDGNRQKFERYTQVLRQAIDDVEQGINDAQLEAKAIKKEMRKETRKWRRYAQVTMENMARTYFENRLLHINSKVHVFSVRQVVLTQRLNDVQQVLDGRDMNSFGIEWFDEAGQFITPQKLKLPDEAESLVQSCCTMEQVVADLRQQYLQLKKEGSVKNSRDERHDKFTEILEIAYSHRQSARHATAASKFHWHPPHVKGTQLKFNCLVLDQRYSPGILLRRWYSKIEKEEDVEPAKITAFIEYLARYLINHYNVDTKYYQTLVLFLERLIFPRIITCNKKPLYKTQQTDQERTADLQFYKKSCWLRMLTQSQIEINSKYCKIDVDENDLNKYEKSDVPFGPAIQALTDEARVYVPSDVLNSVVEAMRQINTCAQLYCNQKQGTKDEMIMIGADDLFPMVVYVVVHSQLQDINTRLGFLERYVKREIKHFGEAGHCLALLQAAVSYISCQEPTNFDLPAELEEEVFRARTKHRGKPRTKSTPG